MKLGDAEVLRNAGGRVTLDMIRYTDAYLHAAL